MLASMCCVEFFLMMEVTEFNLFTISSLYCLAIYWSDRVAALLLSYHPTDLCDSESYNSANAVCISLFLRVYFFSLFRMGVLSLEVYTYRACTLTNILLSL